MVVMDAQNSSFVSYSVFHSGPDAKIKQQATNRLAMGGTTARSFKLVEGGFREIMAS